MEAAKSLAAQLSAPETAELDHTSVERLIDSDGREILRRFFQDHLDLRALREERDRPPQAVSGVDGEMRPHRETGHARQLTCLFDNVTVARCAWRNRGRTNVHLADARLSLPRGRHSHGIKHLAVRESIRGSFAQAVEAIGDRCGPVLGKRRAESLVVEAARDIDAFYHRKIASACTADMPLVIQVDGKGVVMRPEALREPPAKRPRPRSGRAGRPGSRRARNRTGNGWRRSPLSTAPSPPGAVRTTSSTRPAAAAACARPAPGRRRSTGGAPPRSSTTPAT